MWPFCRQPLFAGAMPLMFNATILNGMSLTGRLEEAPTWTPADDGGRLLDVQVGGRLVGWLGGWVGGWVGRCWHQHRRCYVAWQQFGSILAAAGFAFPASGSVP